MTGEIMSLKTKEDDHEGHMECCVKFSMWDMNKYLHTPQIKGMKEKRNDSTEPTLTDQWVYLAQLQEQRWGVTNKVN